MGQRGEEEKGFDIVQRIAFKSHLAYLLRRLKEQDQSVNRDSITSPVQLAKAFVEKHYKNNSEKFAGGIIDIPVPLKSKNPRRNQFRLGETLRSKIRAKRRQ